MYRDPNLLYSICRVTIPSLNINDTAIERVTEFNFLGIIIHQHLKWDSHINKIALKISSATGIIYKFKNIFPQKIILTLYNTLISPHIHYAILSWGYNLNGICISINWHIIDAALNIHVCACVCIYICTYIYRYVCIYIVASELKDPIWHSLEWQIGSFSSEATICVCMCICIYLLSYFLS